MQIYSTTFPVTDKLTVDNFIELVIKWNQSSPHNKMKNLNWDGKNHNIKFEDGNLSLSIEEVYTHNIVAIRFHQLDANNVIWTTDMVVDFNKRIFSIKLDRETTMDTTGFVPQFKAPVIVNMMLESGYVGKDLDFCIDEKTIAIDATNYGVIEDIICRRIIYKMPIVYVTKSWGKYPCNVRELAYKLRGVAHVLIEEDVGVSKILKESCEGKNSHHGSIGIYYPNSSAGYKIISTAKYVGKELQLIDRVVSMVCRYVNQQAKDKLLTWEGVQTELLNLRYASANEKKNQAENEIQEYFNEFDTELQEKKDEIKEKEKTIEELNGRIMALQCECEGLRTKLEQGKETPLLLYGNEEDLYEGEIKEHILELLEDQRRNVQPKSRKEKILLDVLENNSKSGNLKQRRDKIKRILKGYTKVGESLRKELVEFGFEISKDGGHYKLKYYGDSQYLFTMAASGSDSQHGGGNLASEIINKVL